MKLKIFIYISLMVSISSTHINAQVPPELKDVQIKASVHLDEVQKFYFYDYKVMNSENSNSAIVRFTIDVSRSTDSALIDTTGLIFEKKIRQINI